MEKNKEPIKREPDFKRKIGNTTYSVVVHFKDNSEKTFKDTVKRAVMNDVMENKE